MSCPLCVRLSHLQQHWASGSDNWFKWFDQNPLIVIHLINNINIILYFAGSHGETLSLQSGATEETDWTGGDLEVLQIQTWTSDTITTTTSSYDNPKTFTIYITTAAE